jgi:hypothetical protein
MGEIEIITQSRLRAFCKCQRLHDLQYNRGYQSTAPREHADFGTLLHVGLDAWWTAYQRGEEMLALPDALADMTRAHDKMPSLDTAALRRALLLMAAYDSRWAPTQPEFDVLGSEVEFVATIPGRKLLRVAGKIDKIIRTRSTGKVWFVEHKTTGADLSLGSTYWQRLRVDPQVSIYYDGMRALGHSDVEGCLYDVLVRPDQRPYRATPVDKRKYTKATAKEPSRLYKGQREVDETVDEYGDRLHEALAANPDAYFARSTVVRLADELDAMREDVEETALQIRRGASTGAAPRNPDACYLYSRPCEFLGVCSGTESIDDPGKFVQVGPHPELGSVK